MFQVIISNGMVVTFQGNGGEGPNVVLFKTLSISICATECRLFAQKSLSPRICYLCWMAKAMQENQANMIG